MKLAIVVNSLPPYRIHQHRQIGEMAGLDLVTIRLEEKTLDRWSPDVPDSLSHVDYTDKPVTGVFGVLTGLKVVKWIRSNQVDAAIVNGYSYSAYATIIIGCFFAGTPCCVFGDSNIHCDKIKGLKAGIKKIALTALCKMSRMCLPCGTAGIAYFRKYGVADDKISCFPYEPDCMAVQSLKDAAISSVIHNYSLSTDRKRIVFSGRLVEQKRPDIALQSFCMLAEDYPEWDLVFLGDGELKQALIGKIPEELTHRVFFMGFLNKQEDVSAIYRASDVLILPADYEPWALVVHEAVAAGMAVVASESVGAAIDLVENGRNGFKCPVGDVNAFVKALKTVINDLESFKNASSVILDKWMKDNGTVPAVNRLFSKLGLGLNEN